jgi:hypothetical protein
MKVGFALKRIGVIAAVVIVVMLAAGVVGHAGTTFMVPNSTMLNYSLAAGGISDTIYPAINVPVLVLGTNTTPADFSVASATMTHVQGTQIRWVGLEAPPSGAVVQGGSATAGAHVMYLDANHQVDIEIDNADTFVIRNKSNTAQTGTVTLIW